ncbi:MAG: linear amide C-N hydrolase [Clostridium sp.]|nr:linear amide C-N hydrolase [Acetatifactor muris]MCM1527529.1 linear amide C-N hydrolase [Bacteroides sp.]MCM1563771.1 linear amide C-N hydrolase [Clostridium sp.]
MMTGCTGFSWDTADGKHLLGRTYDQFGNLNDNRIAVIPRNYRMKTEPEEQSNSAVVVRYAFAGMAILGAPVPIMVDGINEGGLMGILLNYPGCAFYDTRPRGAYRPVHPGFLVGYLLGQCATVEEAVRHLSVLNLTGDKMFGEEMAVHYMFSDATGEAAIIEPDEDGIHVHRNTLGVMTNSPGYLWQRTNLRNYTAVTNLNTPPTRIINEEFRCFGRGTGGSFGLPGDYSSPARFVRMAMTKNFAVRGQDEADGVDRMFRCFAPVDIPEGLLKATADGADYHQTLGIAVMCAESRIYYFATGANRRIRALSLYKELENKEIKYFELQDRQDVLYLN